MIDAQISQTGRPELTTTTAKVIEANSAEFISASFRGTKDVAMKLMSMSVAAFALFGTCCSVGSATFFCKCMRDLYIGALAAQDRGANIKGWRRVL